MRAPRLDAAKHGLHSLRLENVIWHDPIAQRGVIGLQLYSWPRLVTCHANYLLDSRVTCVCPARSLDQLP